MSQQELKRVEVIALRRSGQISQAEAARRLGITVRQVRRLEARVALRGTAGLRSGRHGRPSNHRLAPATVLAVVALVRAHYRDFGTTLAAEYLQERHGIALSRKRCARSCSRPSCGDPSAGPRPPFPPCANYLDARRTFLRCSPLMPSSATGPAKLADRACQVTVGKPEFIQNREVVGMDHRNQVAREMSLCPVSMEIPAAGDHRRQFAAAIGDGKRLVDTRQAHRRKRFDLDFGQPHLVVDMRRVAQRREVEYP